MAIEKAIDVHMLSSPEIFLKVGEELQDLANGQVADEHVGKTVAAVAASVVVKWYQILAVILV